MVAICDNKSVGMIIRRGDEILLIERKKEPYGFAPPAGHVDQFPSPEVAATEEVREEVGLSVTNVNLIDEGRRDNPCRREGGDHHYWWIYEVQTTGEIKRSKEETRQAGWHSKESIEKLASRTRSYINGDISDDDWEKNPGLEPIWFYWFRELGIL